jgi:hypothetical protein
MLSAADEPVESGQHYLVTMVDGHPPESLDEFSGDIHLTLARNGRDLQAVGSGTLMPDSVRFYQKDFGLHQRDLRVWVITETTNDSTGEATFGAEPFAAF